MDETILESIPRISWEQLEKNFESRTPFEALSPLATCLIRVREVQPFVGIAAHAGHRVREELLAKMLIEEHERRMEEDVGVDLFLDAFPVQVIALDSRYECDVNRPRNQAVYVKPFESWGKRVWDRPPTPEELDFSLAKYDDFHDVVECVVNALQTAFGSTLVLDLHSYNYRRATQANIKSFFPTFDLVLSDADRQAHPSTIDLIKRLLKTIQTPEGPASVSECAVFKKDGAVSMGLQPHLPNVLTVPIEIKKFYMDEHTGELDPSTVNDLIQSFRDIFPQIFAHFRQQRRS